MPAPQTPAQRGDIGDPLARPERPERSDADFRLFAPRIRRQRDPEVAAFCAHPAWVRPYLRCATFKAWLAAADDPELAELPPPPSPGPVPGGARARALPASPLQS